MTVPDANNFAERVPQPVPATPHFGRTEAGGRFWLKLEHDFASDAAFIETADCCGTSPAIVLSVALQLRVRENEGGRRLGPRDLESLAWFCRVPADLVRRIIETLVGLGRVAKTVLTAMTRRVPDPEKTRARWRRARQRFRQKQRYDRRQLNLLLPIGHRASSPAAGDDQRGPPMTSDDPPAEILGSPIENQRGPSDDPPCRPPTEQSRETADSLLKKEAGVSRRCAPSPAAPAPDNGKRRKRANLLKSLGRWVRHSPAVEDGERLGHLDLLARAELALNDWWGRPGPDQRALDALVARMKHAPLPPEIVTAIYQAERGRAPNHGFEAMTAKLGWFHGGGRRDGRAA